MLVILPRPVVFVEGVPKSVCEVYAAHLGKCSGDLFGAGDAAG